LKKHEKISFVLGNGTSRKSIILTNLKESGTVYGCNALYREFCPDHLISVDTKMIKEIIDSKYHLSNSVWSNYNSFTSTVEGLRLLNPGLGWSSGPTALHLASLETPDTVYILGFDYQGTGQSNSYFNNVYADTKNYKKSSDRATFHGNWANQTANIIRKNPKIKYVRVTIEKDPFKPDPIKYLPNLLNITVEKFKKTFKC
jgi:hypothetical protein